MVAILATGGGLILILILLLVVCVYQRLKQNKNRARGKTSCGVPSTQYTVLRYCGSVSRVFGFFILQENMGRNKNKR